MWNGGMSDAATEGDADTAIVISLAELISIWSFDVDIGGNLVCPNVTRISTQDDQRARRQPHVDLLPSIRICECHRGAIPKGESHNDGTKDIRFVNMGTDTLLLCILVHDDPVKRDTELWSIHSVDMIREKPEYTFDWRAWKRHSVLASVII